MLKVDPEGWGGAFARRRVVVTGGAGFLGAHTCSALLDAGAEVICVDNMSSGHPDQVRHLVDHPSGFEVVEADVVAGIEVSGAVDAVIHLACIASPPGYQRLPIETLRAGSEGTLNALRLAARHQARFVLSSTSEVYGDPELSPQSEDYWGNVNPIGPRSMYDEAKRFSEALTVACADSWDLAVGIVRIFNTYGPGMRAEDGRMVSTFIDQALRGEPLTVHGDGTQTRSLCHVSDTVRGLLLMAASDHRGPINLGNPDERSVRELADHIRAAVGSASQLSFGPALPDDPQRRCPDITLARELLGWQPTVSLADGIADTIAYHRT